MTNSWNLRVTAAGSQGGRRYMEDVTAVQFERAKGDKKFVEYAAFAVFDGHGGKEAAHFARDNILDNIKKQKGFFSKDVDLVKKAINDAFIATHYQMWNELPNWQRTHNGHPSTAGTTVSLMIIRGDKMYVANVGDSMVVMGTRDYSYKDDPGQFQAKELTVDHKPELPEEKKRIEKCGGCVMNKAGVNRVVWNRPKISHTGPIRRSTKLDRIPFLAIARSLGDLWSFNSEENKFVVSPVPDVYVHDLIAGREQFVVLASDGLWNMVRPYESVTMAGTFDERKARGYVEKGCKAIQGTPAQELVQLALDRWKMRAMRADNTSVIVIYIERKKMESTTKKKDTYSESWTSGRLENSKFREDNIIPYNVADEPSIITSGDSKNADKIDTPSSAAVGSNARDSSDANVTADASDKVKEQGEEMKRMRTRRLSKEKKSSRRVSTRSSEKKTEPVEKILKRRKSAESVGVVSKGRNRSQSSRKRCKTDFTEVKTSQQKLPEPKKPKSARKRPISLERSSKSQPKCVPASQSRSEPVLSVATGTTKLSKSQTKCVPASQSRSEPVLSVATGTKKLSKSQTKCVPASQSRSEPVLSVATGTTKSSKSQPKCVPASQSRSEPVLSVATGTRKLSRGRRTPVKSTK